MEMPNGLNISIAIGDQAVPKPFRANFHFREDCFGLVANKNPRGILRVKFYFGGGGGDVPELKLLRL